MFNKPKVTYDYDTNEFEKFKQIMIDTGLSADEVAQKMNTKVNPSILGYAKVTKASEQTQEGLNKYIQMTSNSFSVMAIKSKAAAIGVGVLNAASGMIIGTLASLAITGIISLFDSLIVTQEEVLDKAREAQEVIDGLKDSIKTTQETVAGSGKRFAELAQGVNTLTGENKSLSNEEYKEFLNLSNQLAEIFPELDRNYDSNGNAIIQLSGSVDTIVGSLDDLVERQQTLANMEIADKLPDVFDGAKENAKNAKDAVTDYKEQIKVLEAAQQEFKESFYGNYKIPLTPDGKSIQNTFKSMNSDDYLRLKEELTKRNIEFTEKTFKLPDNPNDFYGFDFTLSDEEYNQIITEAEYQFKQLGNNYTEQINQLRQKIVSETEKEKTAYDPIKKNIASWLSLDSNYQSMGTEMQNVMQNIINGINFDNFSNWEAAAEHLRENYLYVFSHGIDTDAIVDLFNESVEELSADEYVRKVEAVVENIQNQLKSKGLDIEFNLDFMIEDEKDLLERVRNKLGVGEGDNTEMSTFVDGLEPEDLSIVLQLEVDKNTSLDKIKADIVDFKSQIEDAVGSINLSKINEELDKIQGAYQTVSSAIEEYDKNHGLSLDTIQSLMGLEDQYIATLFNENGQLTLNTNTYNALAKAQLLSMQATIASNAIDTVGKIKNEQGAKENLKQSTLAVAGAKWEEVYATIELARSELIARARTGENVYAELSALEQLEKSTRNKQKLAEEAMRSMNNAVNMFYGKTPTGGGGSGGGSGKKENIFDWAANSVKNLNREIEDLNRQIENASLEDKLGLYDKLDKSNGEMVDVTKETADLYKDEWNSKKKKISKKYRDRIQSHDTFKVEEFDDEKTYNKVIAAQKAYEEWQNALDSYQDALDKRDQDRLDKIAVVREITQIELDTLTSEDMSNKTASQKNKQLEKEKDAKYKILQCDLKLAKSEAEQTRLRKEYKEYEKEIAEQKYENLRNERNNKIANYQSKVQHTQHDIDLKESVGKHGSKKQYTNMNTQLENQISLEKTNYEKAKTERGKHKVGTDDWNKYNDQMVEAENNIIACIQAQLENNRAIKEMDIRPYEEENEDLEELLDFLGKYQEQLNNAISHANYLIEEEIDKLNEEKEAVTEKYDTQIEAIEKEKELLTEENEERERAIALENAEYNLEKAKRNKTVRVYRKGVGFEYQADSEEIRNAQDELDQLVYENEIANYDKRIEHLNKRKEEEIKALDESIEKWEDYAEALDDAAQSYDRMVAKEDFEELFGANGIRKILKMDESMINTICSKVIDVGTNLKDTNDRIEQNNRTIKVMRENIDNTLINSLSKAVKSLLKKIGIDVSKFHSGGIVGKAVKNDLPEHLMALTDLNLKPNETFAKLLNGEVVLNTAQMGNMFDNLSRAYSALTPLYKRESSPITITIGDVNVYNPENTDMIVNEIVKELPQKVLQQLYSK